MAYETATATDVNDLLDKLRIFALANGWTIDQWADGTNSGKYLSLSKGGVYFHLQSDRVTTTTALPKDSIRIWNSTSFTPATAPASQPNAQEGAKTWSLVGPFTAYHFFTNTSPDYIHIAIEVSSGLYRHIMLGTLVKGFSFTGGQYLMGTHVNQGILSGSTKRSQAPLDTQVMWPFCNGYNTSGNTVNKVRADLDGLTNKWYEFRDGGTAGAEARGVFREPSAGHAPSPYEYPLRCAPNAFNGRSPFFPLLAMVDRSGGYCPVGYAADVRVVNLRNIVAGDTLTIGADEWLVFPCTYKAPDATPTAGTTYPENSWVWGYAYKKVP